MKRFLYTLWLDIRLQFRNGFYYAGAFVAVIFIFLLRQLPGETLRFIFPAFLLLSLNITTYYFMGGLVLLEKREGTLEGLVVTPLLTGEYLGSKGATLTLLALLESLAVILLSFGTGFNLFLLILGIVLMSVIYSLIGFVAISRYDSINQYLMPSFLYVAVLQLPLFHYFGLWESPVLYILPTQAALQVLKWAFQPVAPWQALYGILYSILWIVLVYYWSSRSFHRFIIRKEGVR